MNRADARLYSTGVLLPDRLVALDVPGRRAGRPVSVPLVVANHDVERYLVAMLGEGTGWVRNVRVAGGRAVLAKNATTLSTANAAHKNASTTACGSTSSHVTSHDHRLSGASSRAVTRTGLTTPLRQAPSPPAAKGGRGRRSRDRHGWGNHAPGIRRRGLPARIRGTIGR
jgi:hypothetical protein